jgi:enolase-phosphatase E1
MIEFRGRGILLDIEGTTSSVSFVYDVMFPFVRRELDGYLDSNWDAPSLMQACDSLATDAGFTNRHSWWEDRNGAASREMVRFEVIRLMDGDIKATGLKQLQGLIWRSGFESGELKAHLYPDVEPAVRKWTQADKDVRIYSSGSVQAQKLFFGHTEVGDLLPLLSGHYDTTTGGKKEASSYRTIACEFGIPAAEILFLSDVTAELDAAGETGMQTGLCVRPGNSTADQEHDHAEIQSFHEIALVE